MLQRIATVVSLLVCLAVAGTAFAGNGNGGGSNKSSSSSSSISAPYLAGSTGGGTSAAPRYGDTITFNVSTTATSTPYVNLNCTQNGAPAGAWFAAFFTGGAQGTFILRAPSWSSGAADCTADLGMFDSKNRWSVLASSSFHVNA
jgi:hypothetical protein